VAKPPPAPPADAPLYTPPQRRLGPCPRCACTTLVAEGWALVEGTWQPQGPMQSPCFGEPHDCATALIQYAARWQYTLVLARVRTPTRKERRDV
jgi:hypothetical protein